MLTENCIIKNRTGTCSCDTATTRLIDRMGEEFPVVKDPGTCRNVILNGKKMYLYDFGIETLGYFNAADNEKNAYHINGDEDDEYVKNETNDLLAKINSDPDSVVSFFTQLSQSLYEKLNKLMGTTEFSSVYKVYDDKKMKEDYDEYTTKIAQAEEKLTDYEDKWYKKFSTMETALAKMQSNASAITGLLGGS